jgi:hypothetical protein
MPGMTDPPVVTDYPPITTEKKKKTTWEPSIDVIKNFPTTTTSTSTLGDIFKKTKKKVTQVVTDIKTKHKEPPNDITGSNVLDDIKDYAKIIFK